MKTFSHSAILALLLTLCCHHILNAQLLHPKVKWRFKTAGPIRGAAVLSAEKLYVGSADGFVYALAASDGTLHWKFQTGGAINCTPAVANGAVIVQARDNVVYSIDAGSGDLNWKYTMKTSLPPGYGGWDYFSPAPVLLDQQIMVGSSDGHLYALAENGEERWHFKTGGRISAAPYVHDGVIYLPANDGYVYALDKDKGRLLWKFETRGANLHSADFGFDRKSIYTQPTVRDNTLIFGSRDGHVYAVDLDTRKEKWSHSYGSTWAMATAVSDTMVYAGWSTNNLISAHSLHTGREIWQYKSGAHNYTKPLLTDSALLMGSADGKLYSFNKYTGTKTWEYTVGSEIYSSPLYAGGTLFLGSDDGYLYALEEGQPPYKAVYLPTQLKGIAQYLVVDQRLAPYLKEKAFEQLDSAGLHQFIQDRIQDKNPSVVVFSLPLIPTNIVGDEPEKGMIRQYLEAGGKMVWMGDIPNLYEIDASGNFNRNPETGARLLGVQFTDAAESGNYYSKATQAGLNHGLPDWLKTTGSPVSANGLVPLAIDEFGRVSLWVKYFHPRPGSGFISCRTWGWNVPIKEDDLAIIHQLAVYGLE